MHPSPILIIGKHGKTGARVDARLTNLGHDTRAVSRSTRPAFDWNAPETWCSAIEGVISAYVTYQPDLAVPAAETAITRFVELAARTGLEHIVLLSGRGEPGAERAEAILADSGLDWNVVRASWFAQNFSEGYMLDGIRAGELMLPAGDVPEPFIDIDDVADVAVAALLEPGLRNRLFEVTGPRALTFAECAEQIAARVGYPVRYKQVPVESYVDALRAEGLPNDLLWLLRELFTVVFDGRNTPVMHGVEQALGRRATNFSSFVEKAAATGVWNGTQHGRVA